MRQALKMFSGVFFLLVAGSASAAAVQCVNCSDAQMYAKARTLGASPNAHLVWNPANGAVKKFRNYCGSAPNAGGGVNGKSDEAPKAGVEVNAGCTLQTDEVAVGADVVGVADALGQIWRGTNGTFKSGVRANIGGRSFPTYLPGRPSAHDFLTDIQLRGEIIDLASTPQIFQMSNSALSGPFAYLVGHADAFLAFTQGVVITIDIVFDDGSKIQLRATLGENATYVKDSARDSSGHVLPDRSSNPQDYTGRWYFPPGQGPDMAAFIEYMRSLGIPISSGSANGGVITCNWNPTNNTTTCVIPN